MNTHTDKELLELAAKAAGIFMTREELAEKLPKWEWDEDYEHYHLRNGGMSGPVILYGSNGDIVGTESFEWNPLADDGDALRLAVILRIQVPVIGNGINFDPFAATRRAIVRAAAEIGKKL